MADKLGRAVERVHDKIARLEKVKGFVKAIAVNTLRKWGVHEGCPLPSYFDFAAERIKIGRTMSSAFSVRIPGATNWPIAEINFWSPRARRGQ
jgi:hypothetical protein